MYNPYVYANDAHDVNIDYHTDTNSYSPPNHHHHHGGSGSAMHGGPPEGNVIYTTQDTSTQTKTQETEFGGVLTITTTTVTRTITERVVASDEDDSDAEDAEMDGDGVVVVGEGSAPPPPPPPTRPPQIAHQPYHPYAYRDTSGNAVQDRTGLTGRPAGTHNGEPRLPALNVPLLMQQQQHPMYGPSTEAVTTGYKAPYDGPLTRSQGGPARATGPAPPPPQPYRSPYAPSTGNNHGDKYRNSNGTTASHDPLLPPLPLSSGMPLASRTNDPAYPPPRRSPRKPTVPLSSSSYSPAVNGMESSSASNPDPFTTSAPTSASKASGSVPTPRRFRWKRYPMYESTRRVSEGSRTPSTGRATEESFGRLPLSSSRAVPLPE